MGQEKKFGSKKNFESEKFFGSENFFGSKIFFGSKKMLRSKIIFGSKKMLSLKINLGLNFFWVQFGFENILGPENNLVQILDFSKMFWVRQLFWVQKKCGSVYIDYNVLSGLPLGNPFGCSKPCTI